MPQYILREFKVVLVVDVDDNDDNDNDAVDCDNDDDDGDIYIMMKCVSRRIITPFLESPVTTLYNSRLVFMVFHRSR